MNENIETGKRFYDHIQATFDTQYGYASPEDALAAFTALAQEPGDLDMADFYSGFLQRCQEEPGQK